MPTLVLIDAPADGMTPAPPRSVPPDAFVAGAMDLGLTRGDGIFETIGVHDGAPHDVDPHLERLAQSARLMEMRPPSLAAYREAAALALSSLLGELPTAPPTILVKLVYTRGDGDTPLGYAYAEEFPGTVEARREGVAALTLTRGYPLGIGATAPWLTVGAKTLSYAVNMAALRHAAAHGAQEVLFTTSDGFVLEAPRSTALVRYGGTISTPAVTGGLLHGTAQRAAFEAFEARGFTCEYRDLRAEELESADAVWLTDSAFMLRPVHTLDGRSVPVDAELTAAVIADMLAHP